MVVVPALAEPSLGTLFYTRVPNTRYLTPGYRTLLAVSLLLALPKCAPFIVNIYLPVGKQNLEAKINGAADIQPSAFATTKTFKTKSSFKPGPIL